MDIYKLLQNSLRTPRADPDLSNDDGATPLYAVSNKGHKLKLLEAKADPIVPTNDKSTPLLITSANNGY